MNQPSFLSRIWKDPVLSKVISTGILAILGFFIYEFAPTWRQSAKTFFLTETLLPNWALIIVALAIALSILLFWRYLRPTKKMQSVTSSEWFTEIERQISDCSLARIYLRGFSHPDQFRAEHRDSLLNFMHSLVERFESGADIEIVAYHYPESKKSGLDWIKSELGEESNAISRITLINKQPVANSASFYLFDSGAMLYNQRVKKQYTYHVENLQGTVIHHLLERGFRAVRSKLK